MTSLSAQLNDVTTRKTFTSFQEVLYKTISIKKKKLANFRTKQTQSLVYENGD